MGVLVLILIVGLTTLRADEIDLGERGVLKISIPGTWRLSVRKAQEVGYGAALKPVGGAHAKCLLTIAYLHKPESVVRAMVDEKVQSVAASMVRKSASRNLKIESLGLTSGYGAYTLFAGYDLQQRPQEKDDYQVIGTGIVRPTEELIVVVTLYADTRDGAEMKTILNALKSMSVARTK